MYIVYLSMGWSLSVIAAFMPKAKKDYSAVQCKNWLGKSNDV